MHQDGEMAHAPLAHSPEQHSALPPHELPAVLQLVLSATHFPLLQLALQQDSLLVQASLSLMHLVPEQLPFSHRSEQQAVFEPQASPPARQGPMSDLHKLFSHTFEQHWSFDEHALAAPPQTGGDVVPAEPPVAVVVPPVAVVVVAPPVPVVVSTGLLSSPPHLSATIASADSAHNHTGRRHMLDLLSL
jgi:hypothetical protein